MFLQKSFAAAIISALLFVPVFGQQKNAAPPPLPISNEIPPAVKREAVALLRETIREIGQLKSPENRQFFSVAAADLLWEHDPQQARAMFEGAMNEARRSLAGAVAAINESEAKAKADETGVGAAYAGNYASNSAYSGYLSLDRELRIRINKALAIRALLISGLAENDPQAADNFLRETSQTIGSSKFKSFYISYDDDLQQRIALQYAKKDPDKSAAVARRLMEKDYSDESLRILEEIYKQNADRGNLLAEEFLQKLKTSKPAEEDSYSRNSFAIRLFRTAAANLERAQAGNKKPLLAESSVRDLADYIAELELQESSISYRLASEEITSLMKKYAPEKMIRIQEKQGRERETSANYAVVVNSPRYTVSNTAAAGTSSSNAAVMSSSNTAVVVRSNTSFQANSVSNTYSREDAQRMIEEQKRRREQQKRRQAERAAVTEKLKQKNLSAEEKTSVLGQIRKFASESRERDEKIKNLVVWAILSAEGGNAEIAEIVMREAESLAGRETRSAGDYASKWQLASGYCRIAPARSFEILETIVPPFNEIVTGFTKIAEFIDDERGMFSDGEILMTEIVGMGYFNHSSGIRLDMMLPRQQRVAQNLARADFARTRKLTDKFERLELRTLARLMVLRSVLKPQEAETRAQWEKEAAFVPGDH